MGQGGRNKDCFFSPKLNQASFLKLTIAKVMTQTQSYTILIVEDTYEHLETLRNLLQHEGYDVITARTADEAIVKFHKHKPDMVLMDIRLSENKDNLTGIDVAEALSKFRDFPIIFITGFRGDYLEEARKRVKYASFTPKPYDPDKLIIDMEDILRKFYAEKEPDFYPFRCDGNIFYLQKDEIVYLASEPDITTVHIFRNGKKDSYIRTSKLTETKELFFGKHPNLKQVHKQFYVNTNWIDTIHINGGSLQLKAPFEEHCIYVGEKYKENLKRKI